MKTTDNHDLSEIDRLVKPATSTMIDRYIFANHWTKDKTVIDAATGKGYGAGILLALGAKSVVGIDIDEEGVEGLYQLLQEIKKNKTIFVITHNKYLKTLLDSSTRLSIIKHKGLSTIKE